MVNMKPSYSPSPGERFVITYQEVMGVSLATAQGAYMLFDATHTASVSIRTLTHVSRVGPKRPSPTLNG